MKGLKRCLSLIVCFATVSAAIAAGDNPIDAPRAAFINAFNKGDAAGMKGTFESDVLLLTFTGQTITGADTISKGMASMSSHADLDEKPMQVRISGDMAYEAGTWTHKRKGGTESLATGTYVTVWHKQK